MSEPITSRAAERSGNGSADERIRAVGRDLAATLREVLEALPNPPGRPTDLARDLGLNRDISSRVLKAMAKQNPLEVVHVIPGPEPLRRFIRAAADQDVAERSIDAAQEAVQRFDGLIRDEAGTRSALNAIIASLLPRTQQRFELASRQSVFKGMSQLKGIQADVWLSTAIIAPSTDVDDKHDVVLIHGALSMQKLRPDARVKFTYSEMQTEPPDDEDGLPEGAIRLDEFCVNPPAPLDIWRSGSEVSYTLSGEQFGPRAIMDMLVVDHHRAVLDRYANPDVERSKKGTFVAPDIPVKLLVFDCILHNDVWPGSDPELAMFDMGPAGTAWVNDPSRDIDRMDFSERVELMGRGVQSFRSDAVPRYTDMLRAMAQRNGLNLDEFRGYRCLMQYPVHGWQVCLSFDPPKRPS